MGISENIVPSRPGDYFAPEQLSRTASAIERALGPHAAGRWSERRWRAWARHNDKYPGSDPNWIATSKRLTSYRGAHQGGVGVIVGNGPSLNRTNVDLIRNLPSFGLNRVYLAFEKWGFSTTYHLVINRLVAEQSGAEILGVKSPIFTSLDNADIFGAGAETSPIYVGTSRPPGFFGSLVDGVFEGSTVTYVAMQLAYFMGFTKVILIGVDHRFVDTGKPHQEIESSGDDANHFDTNYFGRGYRWHLPDLEGSERSFAMARDAFTNDGRQIIDATVDGALSVFPKMSLEDALR